MKCTKNKIKKLIYKQLRGFNNYWVFIIFLKKIDSYKVETGYCLFMIGLHYLQGYGVEYNANKALEYYEKAVENGNSISAYYLGLIYQQRKPKNYKKSFEYFEKAVELGDVESYNYLSHFYMMGTGVKQDLDKSMELIEKAINLGNPTAMHKIANFYETGLMFLSSFGTRVLIKKDQEKSISHYKMAADLGYVPSILIIAKKFKEGKDVEKNLEQSFLYYNNAASKGNLTGLSNLVTLFINHKKDLNKAVHYLYKLYKLENQTNYFNCKNRLMDIISTSKIEWNKDHHIFWRFNQGLNDQLITLLLVSKYRDESTKDEGYVLSFEVVMVLIKFLCQFKQTKKKAILNYELY
eukprot:TRINITY_DN725_c0_g1_i1.p1 TRINITY_DN725_c0_g1~~TRINITY_DN725_c0_g1_i1.p1  ORF type:complete len:351 (-),score=68.37 TRINITY_DN725_c0_g1_i1:38-1090(-)